MSGESPAIFDRPDLYGFRAGCGQARGDGVKGREVVKCT